MSAEPVLDVAVVLVNPARGANIGAAARALNTMGFDDLRIVGDSPVRSGEAFRVAHRSGHLLDAAATFTDLESALADRDLAVATTGRRRAHLVDYLTPEEVRDRLTADWARHVAIVFGSEESGLTNEQIAMCQAVSAIPMRRAQPSLNLAQAVMVYAYILSPLRFRVHIPRPQAAHAVNLRMLKRRLEAFLPAVGIQPGLALSNRILERAGELTQIDANLVHSMLKHLESRVVHGPAEGPSAENH